MTAFYFHPEGDIVSLPFGFESRQYAKHKGAWYLATHNRIGWIAWREVSRSEHARFQNMVARRDALDFPAFAS